MNRARIAEGTHLAFAGFWLAAILMTGVVAALTFPTLKDLSPHLPEYASYDADHWSIAGGYVTNPIFGILRGVQWFCAAICGVTLLALIVQRASPRTLSLIRVLALILVMGILVYESAVLSSRMATSLASFRYAAAAGDVIIADEHRDAFDQDHPTASRLLMINAGGVAVLLGAGLVACRKRVR